MIGTDRHVSQGGVEWVNETWQPGELVCVFKLVADDPLTAIVHVPSSFKLQGAKSDDAAVVSQSLDGVVAVELCSSASKVANLVLDFDSVAK